MKITKLTDELTKLQCICQVNDAQIVELHNKIVDLKVWNYSTITIFIIYQFYKFYSSEIFYASLYFLEGWLHWIGTIIYKNISTILLCFSYSWEERINLLLKNSSGVDGPPIFLFLNDAPVKLSLPTKIACKPFIFSVIKLLWSIKIY